MKILIKPFAALIAFMLFSGSLSAQLVSIPDNEFSGLDYGDEVLIPINTTDITATYGNIIIATVKVEFDTDVLTYLGYTNLNSGFPPVNISVNPNGSAGVLQFNIEDQAFSGYPFPDGKMLDMRFSFLGGSCDMDITLAEFLADDFETYNSPVQNGSAVGYFNLTATDGDWSQTATWTGDLGPYSEPSDKHNVTILSGGTVMIPSAAVANKVTIANGGRLTLNSSQTLAVTDAFIVESGGSFIQNGTLTAGSTLAERMIATATPTGLEGWHLLSSPVMSQPIAPDFGGSVGQDFYGWDETVTNGLPWINFNGGTFSGSSFNPGTGYLVAYQSGQSGTKQFAGAFNSTDFTGIALTNSFATTNEDWNGFNLLGNPFPSAIVWNKTAWNGGAPIQASAYLWDEASADYIDLFEDDVVPAMNGFMVYTSADATIDIPLAARVHDATPWYKASEEQRITLVAHDPATGSSKGSMVRFNSQATSGYDLDFDSRLLVGYAPIFFSKAEGTNLQVNTLPELTSDVVVPFGFITNGSTDFYIQMTATIETENILLVDRKLNIVHDLTANPVYHFTSVEGDNVNRFELKFGHVGVNANPAAKSDVTVYVRDRSIYVSGNSSLAGRNIIVTNMMGQQVMKVSANDGLTVVNASNLQSGAYLVSVISENSVVTQKIVLNR